MKALTGIAQQNNEKPASNSIGKIYNISGEHFDATSGILTPWFVTFAKQHDADMDVWNLDIPLRGERDYVQSSDLFAALEYFARRDLSTRAYVQKLILRQMSRYAVEAHFIQQPSALGTFELRDQKCVKPGWLIETSRNIACRKPYDETPVIRAAAVQAGRAQLLSPVHGYTAFDQIIILSKIIGAQIAAGTWVFSRVDLDEPLREDLSIELVLSQVILSRCQILEIRQGNKTVGRAQGVLQQFKDDSR